ncbi:hypothetical protein V6238_01555 [Marinomonas arenicola]|uniref:hypothetical protein n=1 Tax=Marinomonas arenicola TaxID=569601 RepID=UPI00311DDBFA
MTAQSTKLSAPQSILFTFTATDLNVLRLIANHWSKMFVCHEIDRGLIPGETIMTIWSPEYTLMKLRDMPTFYSHTISKEVYEFGVPLAQYDWPLCCWELEMLAKMTRAAVTGELDRFMLNDKGVMRDVLGTHFTQSWTCNSSAMAVANKLNLLDEVSGMFFGSSSYELAMLHVKRAFRTLDGVEAVVDA